MTDDWSDEGDYLALDVSGLCNARAADAVAAEAPLGAPSPAVVPILVGRRSFRGLPFAIGRDAGSGGPDDSADLVILGGSDAATEVRVGRSARWLIFAHRLLETTVYTGGPVGDLVATYVV